MYTPCIHHYLHHVGGLWRGVPPKGQKSVTISAAMHSEIKRLVEESPELFDSISQFVKFAITDFVLKTRAGKR